MGRTYWESASQTATRTKVAQGTDGSPLYVRNNAGNFIFAHANSGTVVSFKAFLSEFNMKINYAHTQEDEVEGGTVEKTMATGPEISYSVGLTLVAHSLTEAKLNLSRINEVNKMYSQIADPTGLSDVLTIEAMDHFIIQYSNLISADYKKKINYFDKETLLTQGVPGYITSFDFTVNKEIGMFEEGGKLFPKLIDFKFELLMSQRLYRINYLKTYGKSFYYLYLPFKTDGKVWSHDNITYSVTGDMAVSQNSDIGTFPFGLDISKEPISKYPPSGMGRDGSVDYSQNKQGNIFFAGNRVKNRFVSFKPFLESLSLKLAYKEKTKSKDFTMGSIELERSGKLSKTQDLNLSFNCVAHSVEEARQNMIKVQSLLRLLIGIVPDGGDTAIPEIEGSPVAPTGIFNYKISAKGDSSQNIVFIKFSNIIAKKIGYVSKRDDIENFGRSFFVNSYGLDVLEEMGMFEHNGMFYFKVMKLTFDLSEVISVERPYEASLDDKDDETLHMWKKNQNGKLKTNEAFDQDLFVGEDFDDLILTYYKGKVP
jgi:hypothetical protein